LMFKLPFASCRSFIAGLLLLGLTIFLWTGEAVTPAWAAPAQQDEAEWTIMLYQDADDEVLEQDIMIDFNEAERVGSTDQVNIVAQIDRYEGAFDGMGDWTGTKRFYVTQDDNLDEIGSEEIEDLSEVNMADGQSLVDFINWAVQNYPAKKYALIMSDHGAGWPGGWNDPDPGGLGPDNVIIAQLFGVDGLWLMELDRALEQARTETGLDQFEMVGFDACLMGQLEVFSTLAPHARYSVASQEVEPALGWAYTSFLNELVNNPEMDGRELSRAIVDTYIDQDQRIVDDDARSRLVEQNYGVTDPVSPEEVAAAMGRGVTLTAVDLAEMPAVNAAVDSLATALASADSQAVAEARAYAQSFESVFGDEVPSPYIDLGHFTQLAVELTGSERVTAAAQELYDALGRVIIAEKHGDERPGATGVTIHFPTREIFGAANDFGYEEVAQKFAAASRWNEYLASFHSGGGEAGFSRPNQGALAAQPAQPPLELTREDVEIIVTDIAALLDAGYYPEETPQAMVDEFGYQPELVQALIDVGFFDTLFSQLNSRSSHSRAMAGPKPIQLSPLTLSSELAVPDQPVTFSADISGDRLAHVYSFIGRFLPRQNVLLIEDIDYIFADDTKEVNGVKYPVWPKEGFSVEYEWEPNVYAINDGQTSVKALFEPQAYDDESPTYSVGGTYRFASGGDPRFAKIYFRDDKMTEIFGFTGSITQAVGAPRQITPQVGDQFTVLERGDDLNQEDEAGREKYVQEGGTVTYNGQPFTLETTPASSGNYVVGLIAEDLDGQRYEQYEGLFVVNPEAEPVDGYVSYVNESLGFALLHPEAWQVEENEAESWVNLVDPESGALVNIQRSSYPDAADATAANDQAIQEAIDALSQDGSLENLQFVTDVEDYWLGSFEAKTIDFAADVDGQPYYGYLVASTPQAGDTYVVAVAALDADFDALAADFDNILYSFDILISGVSREQVGPPAPDLAETTFSDDFSDPTSGLIDEPTEQEWGRSYYQDGQYIFELNPAPGAIYDYYAAPTLPDAFLMQAAASYSGAADNGYGLIFRVQVGEESDDFYAFRISGDGFYTVEKTENGQLATLIDWTPSSQIDQAEGTPNLLAVQGDGDAYALYINGRQVGAFTDDAYTGGTFGFMVDNYDEKAPATFTFDDLAVGTAAQ
jgi:hypothetical protein